MEYTFDEPHHFQDDLDRLLALGANLPSHITQEQRKAIQVREAKLKDTLKRFRKIDAIRTQVSELNHPSVLLQYQ
jgi:hypothetical protein